MENDLGANWTNMTHSHQDKFSWVPNFHWDPLNAKKNICPETYFGYVKMHGYHGNPCTILKNGGVSTKSTIFQLLLNLEY